MVEVVGYRVEDNADIEESIINAARKHYKDGNYDSAIRLYLGLLKTSASSRLYMDVGLCYYKKNDYDTAIEYLTQAATLDIRNSVAFSYLGNCYFRKQDANNAIGNWIIARSLSPKDEFVCLNLAIAYFAKNMHYESVYYYDKYLKYAQNKDINQYKVVYQNISRQMNEANEYFLEGEKHRARNEGIPAEQNYLAAYKKFPIMPEYSLALADLYYESKNYVNAIPYYETSMREFSEKNREIFYKIANCFEQTGDYRLAFCFYSRYLKYTISSQNEYLEITKRITNLKKLINVTAPDITLELAKKYYQNNEYYKALIEYENYSILNPQNAAEYISIINQLKSFVNSEQIITKQYLKKGDELLQKGEAKGANKYFTEVMHLSNPKSREYKLAKSKLVNVK